MKRIILSIAVCLLAGSQISYAQITKEQLKERMMKTLLRFMLILLCGIMMVTSFTACGGGDDDDGGNQGSNNDYSALIGKWTGSDKNDGGNCIVTMTLNSDQSAQFRFLIANGYGFTTAENDNNARFRYDSSMRELKMILSDNTYLTFENVSVVGDEMQFYFMDRVFYLTRSTGTGGGGSVEDGTEVSTLKISAVKLSSGDYSYSNSTATMYIKYVSGSPYLYTRAGSLVGAVKSNPDSSCGPYKVSQYTYRAYTSSTSSITYYYFN